jgi:hypothetical protein
VLFIDTVFIGFATRRALRKAGKTLQNSARPPSVRHRTIAKLTAASPIRK